MDNEEEMGVELPIILKMSARKRNNKSKRRNGSNNKTLSDGNTAEPNLFQRLPRTTIQKSILGMPDRYITKLQYDGMGNLTITGPNQSNGARYRPSAAYDVDPVLASTSTPYFAEFAAIYTTYRVTSSKITLKMTSQSNATGQGILVVLCPLNIDPGASPSGATVTSWIAQPYAVKGMLGTAGSPELILTQSMSTERIYGSKMVYFDDNFSSAVTTVPTNNWYWAIGSITATVPATAQVMNLFIQIQMDVEFYGRRVLAA